MKKIDLQDIAHLGILDTFGEKERKVTKLSDCYSFNPYTTQKEIAKSLHNKHIADATPEEVRSVLGNLNYQKMITRKEKELLDNLNERPLIQCGYLVPFDAYGNAGLLLARKDVEKLYAILDLDEIDQIRWYHPKTHKYLRGLEGLIRGDDKAEYALDHLSPQEKEEVLLYERGILPTYERIIKTIGGKHNTPREAEKAEDLRNLKNHRTTVKQETREETGRSKLMYITPFAKIIEEKEKMVKLDVAHFGFVTGKREGKKFSTTEIPQDLVEIYLPIDIAISIFHKTIFRKLEEETKDTPMKRKKLSSCVRSYLFFKYFKQHKEEIITQSKIPKKYTSNWKRA